MDVALRTEIGEVCEKRARLTVDFLRNSIKPDANTAVNCDEMHAGAVSVQR